MLASASQATLLSANEKRVSLAYVQVTGWPNDIGEIRKDKNNNSPEGTCVYWFPTVPLHTADGKISQSWEIVWWRLASAAARSPVICCHHETCATRMRRSSLEARNCFCKIRLAISIVQTHHISKQYTYNTSQSHSDYFFFCHHHHHCRRHVIQVVVV